MYIYIYLFSGGPGSGRGTQCEKLVLKHKFKHLSSGDLLRHEVMSGSQRGGNLYKLMSSGEPVPNGIVNDLIAEAMVKFADGNDVCSIYCYLAPEIFFPILKNIGFESLIFVDCMFSNWFLGILD